MELRSHGFYQPPLFCVVLCVLPQPERGQVTVSDRAGVHHSRRRPAGRSSQSRERSPARLLTSPARSLRLGPGLRFLQLQFLSFVDLVTKLSLCHSSCGLAPFGSLHKRPLAVRDIHGFAGWWVAGGCADSAGLEADSGSSNRIDRRNDSGAWNIWRRECPHSSDGALLDKPVSGRPGRRCACGLVDSVADRSPRKCRHTGRNH